MLAGVPWHACENDAGHREPYRGDQVGGDAGGRRPQARAGTRHPSRRTTVRASGASPWCSGCRCRRPGRTPLRPRPRAATTRCRCRRACPAPAGRLARGRPCRRSAARSRVPWRPRSTRCTERTAEYVDAPRSAERSAAPDGPAKISSATQDSPWLVVGSRKAVSPLAPCCDRFSAPLVEEDAQERSTSSTPSLPTACSYSLRPGHCPRGDQPTARAISGISRSSRGSRL